MLIGRRIMNMLIEADIVTDYCDDYGEPGYSIKTDHGFVALGNYWCYRQDCGYPHKDNNGRTKLHSVETHYPRLFAAMEEQAIEFHWYDEWIVDSNNNKAYRTKGDSWHWQSSICWTDGGDFLTPDDDIEDWVEEIVNNPRRAMPNHIWSDGEIEALGFSEYQCGYENGWHPGQTDDPEEISKIIEVEYAAQDKKVDILYKLSYVSMFDLGFCVFVRERKDGED